MSTDVTEDLVRVYRSSIPQDITATPFGLVIAETVAEMMTMAYNEAARLAAGARVGTAVGLFLDAWASNRGLRRQGGETDGHLRPRLQRPIQAVTVESIIEAIQAIIGDGEIIIVELPRSSCYFDRGMCFDTNTRMGGGRGVVIALIPASAHAKSSVTDALRSKVSAGKIWFVEEYT